MFYFIWYDFILYGDSLILHVRCCSASFYCEEGSCQNHYFILLFYIFCYFMSFIIILYIILLCNVLIYFILLCCFGFF